MVYKKFLYRFNTIKLWCIAFVVGGLIVLSQPPELVGATPLARPNPADGLILVSAQNIAAMDEAINFIEANGGEVMLTFAPHALLVKLPSEGSEGWIGQSGIEAVITAEADVSAIKQNYDEQAALAAQVWNSWLLEEQLPEMPPLAPGDDLINDALELPERSSDLPEAPPQSWQTSEFLYGRVQIDVFLVESDGSIDANQENWTTTQENQVVNEITSGVSWWYTTVVKNGQPGANLNFNLNFHLPSSEPNVVKTGYEPINRSSTEDGLWVRDVMGHLGYVNSGIHHGWLVRDYVHDRRESLNRDWAFAIFVVDSAVDSDGMFSNGAFGYAYLSGPYVMMTYDNDGWDISRMEMVTAHEMAHIFGVGDEYASSGCSDSERHGYLNVLHTNCENGDAATEHSIMRSAESQGIAYPNHLLSTPGRGQIGWRDSDNDGLYDVADTSVDLDVSYVSGGKPGQAMSYTGTAEDIPYPSPTWTDVSLNEITAVQYRINNGGWQSATPADGAFDEYLESFTLMTPSLNPGTYTIDIRAINSVNNMDFFSQTFTVLSAPTNLQASDGLYKDRVKITWDAVSETIDEYAVYRATSIDGFKEDIGTTGLTYFYDYSAEPGVTYYYFVRTYALDGFYPSDYSNADDGFVIPAPPQLIAPPDGTLTRNPTLPLEWSSSTGAHLYQLQLSNTADFSGSSYIYVLSETAHPYGPLVDQTYYWRVRSAGVVGNLGDWSEIWSVTIDTTPPLTPILITPENNSFITNNQPIFEWSSDETALEYHLLIDNNNDFSSPEVDLSLSDASYTPDAGLADGAYYWKVQAEDEAGNWSDWSAVWSVMIDSVPPDVPVLYKPGNGLLTSDSPPTFQWYSIIDAVEYQLQVSTSTDFSTTVISESLTSSVYTPTSLSDGTYYWRVKARDAAGNWSGWSSSWQITLDTIPPGVPQLFSPSKNFTTSIKSPFFDWFTVSGAYMYQMQVDVNPTFPTPLLNKYTTDSFHISTITFSDNTYYWRVRARDEAGNWSGWSEIWPLTIDTTPPDIPILETPDNYTLTADNVPTFGWNSNPDVARYQFQIDDDTNFFDLVLEDYPSGSTYTSTIALTDGVYYWRVRARDDVGNWSNWSGYWQITIDTTPPPVPVLYDPADNTAWREILALDWYASTGAVEYRLWVDDSADFDTPLLDVLTTDSLYSLTESLGEGGYYWQVQARDTVGNWSDWSEPWFFSIDTTPPSAPILKLPGDGTFISDTLPTFEWTLTEDAVQYRVQLSDSIDFANLVREEVVDELNYTPTIPLPDGIYYWRVQAKDAVGNWGEWSVIWSVNIDTVPPPTPILYDPPTKTLTNESIVTLEWSSSLDVVLYHVQIDDENFSDLVIEEYQMDSPFTTPPLADGTYYWRVRSTDVADNWSQWSDVWQFTIDTEMPTSDISTSSGTVMTQSFTISWEGSDIGSTLKHYDLQYKDDDGSWQDWLLETTETEATFDTPQDGHTYCFRVRAEDMAGNIESYPEGESGDICVTIEFRPDLLLSTLDLSSSAICLGEPVTLSTTIYNYGSKASDNFLLAFYDDEGMEEYLAQFDHLNLEGPPEGDSITYEYPFTPTITGIRYIKALVDADEQIKELDENNNGNYKTLIVNEDSAAPVGSLTVNGGLNYTNKSLVSLNLTASDGDLCASGVTQMSLFYNDEWHDWEPYTVNKEINLTGGDGTYALSVKYKDALGHISSVYTGNLITIDTIPPTSAITSLVESQAEAKIQVQWTGSDNSGIACYEVQVRVGETGSWNTWQNCTTATEATYTGSNGQTYYFRIRAKDLAGNWELYPGNNTEYDATTTIDDFIQVYLPAILR